MLQITKLNSSALKVLPRDKTWVFLSIGTLEDHGPHLPVGLDLKEGEIFNQLLLEKLKAHDPEIIGLQFPSIPLSIDSATPHFSLRQRSHVVRDYLVDWVDSYYKEGFRYFAVYSGTFGPKQLTAIEDAASFIRKKHRGLFFSKLKKAPVLVSLSSLEIDNASNSRSVFRLDPHEHGGKRDTAFIHFYSKEELHFIPPEINVDQNSTPFSRFLNFKNKKTPAFWGHPEKYTDVNIQQIFNEKINHLVPKMIAVMKGINQTTLFRSRFAWVPSNHSLFRVYILGFFLITLVLGWILLMLNTLLPGL